VATEYKALDIENFCKKSKIPIMIGNTVSYDVSLELMEAGASAILVGIGPGAACTSRGVLGIGVPQITATVDCAAARDYHFKRKGKYVPIITDGGMRIGGEVCKAIAAGGDACMVGSAFAKAFEAPGRGYHWGMATSNANLPRGTRVKVGQAGTLKEILLGPAKVDDGSQNLVGALKTSMGSLGASNIKEMHDVEIIIAHSFQSEGKVFQMSQKIGMGK
jgi:IMP dehydrogenase